MNIPFGNLQAEYSLLKKEIDEAILRVLQSGWFILGNEVESFEKKFADYCKVKHCIAVGNGLEAIQMSLLAAGVTVNDEVITTPLSAMATTLAILNIGAKPIFTDINPDTFNIDPSLIEKKVSKMTRAIIPVHLYGQVAPMTEILEVAQKFKLIVIEDAAQAHGAQYKSSIVGTIGDAGAFSFYPSKNLGAYGDAGCIITNKTHIAEKAYSLRDYGQSGRYNHEFAGLNSRMDEIQAAILSVKLKFLNKWNDERRNLARYYTSLLSDTQLRLPKEIDEKSHVWHLYVIRSAHRDALQVYLKKCGIITQIHYPTPLYRQKAYCKQYSDKATYPVADNAARELLSLPLYPGLSKKEVRFISDKIHIFCRKLT